MFLLLTLVILLHRTTKDPPLYHYPGEYYENETQWKRKVSVHLSIIDCVQAPEVEPTPSERFRTQNFIAIIYRYGCLKTMK